MPISSWTVNVAQEGGWLSQARLLSYNEACSATGLKKTLLLNLVGFLPSTLLTLSYHTISVLFFWVPMTQRCLSLHHSVLHKVLILSSPGSKSPSDVGTSKLHTKFPFKG